MNILTKTIIAAGAWLALATSIELSYGEAALVLSSALAAFTRSVGRYHELL
jgi:hypothetical protein